MEFFFSHTIIYTCCEEKKKLNNTKFNILKEGQYYKIKEKNQYSIKRIRADKKHIQKTTSVFFIVWSSLATKSKKFLDPKPQSLKILFYNTHIDIKKQIENFA